MAVPRVNSASFELGGRKFYRYLANDAHGSASRLFMVDDTEVTRVQFQDELVKAMKNSNMWDCIYTAALDAYFGLK